MGYIRRMFLGHFALGFAARPLAPKQGLGLLLLAPMWLDIVCPILLLAGAERARVDSTQTEFFPLVLESLPWSHSLLAAVVWSVLWAAVVWVITRDLRGALIGAALVASHWVMDWVTHAPDLQLVPWDERRVGLGLWHSLLATFAVELPVWIAGCAVYLRTTRPRDAHGRRAPLVFMAVLTCAYLATPFAPLPGSVALVASGMLVGIGALLASAAWFDRRRDVVVEG